MPLFLTEFLKARIIPKRIEHGIEPEQRGSERRKLSKSSLYCFGARDATIFSERHCLETNTLTASVLIDPRWGLARLERTKSQIP